MRPVDAARALRDEVDALEFGVDCVYNPLQYAWEPHAAYCTRFGESAPRRVVLVGMNPGPHGMGQTGVPFGDVASVRDWMGITGEVGTPPRLHAKRPITGFATKRSEPSGSRLYGWARERYGTAERFFSEFFIVNYVPLLFFDDAGKNLTPPQLRKADVAALYDACDRHLARVVRSLEPEFVVGIGRFAYDRAAHVIETEGLKPRCGQVLHPSPASPLANKGWAQQAEAQLAALGVELP